LYLDRSSKILLVCDFCLFVHSECLLEINTKDIPQTFQIHLETEKQFVPKTVVCEQKELEEGGQLTKDSELNFCLQILANLIKQDLHNARFVWRRVPRELKKRSKDLQSIWRVVQALWAREPRQFYSSIETYAWPTVLQPWIVALTDTTRAKYRSLIAKGYSTISVDSCCQMLGLPKEKLSAYVPKWNVEKGFVFPTAEGGAKDQAVTAKQVQQLTDYVVQLETLS